MSNILKRSLALVLMLTCAMSFSTTSFAANTQPSDQCGDNVFWSFDEATGVLTISGSGEVRDYDYDLVKGEPMPWHGQEWTISKLIIKEGITGIGKAAFYNVEGLKEVNIPKSVKKIGYFAFRDCGSIEKIYYAGTLGDWCGIEFDEYGANPMNPIDLRFDNDCELYVNNNVLVSGDIEIPAGTTSINGYSFVDYKNITSVKIPSSVKTIGKEAFLACENLSDVIFEEGLEHISKGAFRDCWKLEKISLPNSVTTVDMAAFSNCRALKFFETGKGLKEFFGYTFANAYALEKVTINGEISAIPEYTFSCCYNLKEVSLPNSVKKIERYAFTLCNKLTDIYFYGTEEEWNAIEISDTENKIFENVTVHYMGASSEIPEEETGFPETPEDSDIKSEATFFDKVESFFESIGDFFVSIFDWFANLIKS